MSEREAFVEDDLVAAYRVAQRALIATLADTLEEEDDEDLEDAVEQVHGAAGAPPGCSEPEPPEPFDLDALHASALRRALRTFGLVLLLSFAFCFGIWLALVLAGVGL